MTELGHLAQANEACSSAPAIRPIVVKLGGSVVRCNQVEPWLEAIAAANSPIVVVPGGGAFADEVRRCQTLMGFGDKVAHRMALLAMDQTAWAVAGIRPDFELAKTEEAIRATMARGRVSVWAPYASIAERSDIEASWRLTSDSLALWLAGEIGADACFLIKSTAARSGMQSARGLARAGVLDEAFPDMHRDVGTPTLIFGRGDREAFAACVRNRASRAGLAIV